MREVLSVNLDIGRVVYRSRLSWVATLFCSFMLLGVFASPAFALPQNFFGQMANGEEVQSEAEWDAMERAGTEVYRMTLYSDLSGEEHFGSEYFWPTFDQIFTRAAKRGITVLPILWGKVNVFAQGYPTEAEYKDEVYEKWITATVDRYGYGGDFWEENPTLPYKPVEAWEFWGEANLPQYNPVTSQGECEAIGQTFYPEWNTCPQPEAYGGFLRTSAADLRSAQLASNPGGPAPEVLFSSRAPFPNSLSFFEEAYEVPGVPSSFDGLAIHPYSFGVGMVNLFKKFVTDTRDLLDGVGATNKSIWITEVGWPVTDPGMAAGEFGVTEAEQASLLKETMSWTKAESENLDIRSYVYYTNRDIPVGFPGETSWGAFCGLRNRAGENRAAWKVFREEAGAAPWTPTVTIKDASGITGHGATLKGTVDGHGFDASYRFEYLTEAEYKANGESFSGPNSPTKVPTPDVNAGPHLTEVQQAVNDLAPVTVYRYRLSANTVEGESHSAVKSGRVSAFKTPAIGSSVSLVADGRMFALTMGSSQSMNSTERKANWAWQSPISVAGSSTTYSRPVSVKDSAGNLFVLAEGPSHTLQLTYRYVDGSWHGPYEVSGPGVVYSTPAVVTDSANNLFVLAEGPNHTLQLIQRNPDGSWKAPSQVGGSGTAYSAPTAVMDSSGNISILTQGASNTLRETQRYANGSWHGPFEVGGSGAAHSTPTAVIDPSNNIFVLAQGASNTLQLTQRYWDWSWHGPYEVGGSGTAY